jgi:uncharacterized membrane protein
MTQTQRRRKRFAPGVRANIGAITNANVGAGISAIIGAIANANVGATISAIIGAIANANIRDGAAAAGPGLEQ